MHTVKHDDEYHSYWTTVMTKSKYSLNGNKGIEGLERAQKIILDCDPGGDDAQAMVLAFHMAKQLGVPVLGVTTVAGNAVLEQVVLNSQMILSACDVGPEVPILRGEEPKEKGKELAEFFYGPDGFGNALLEYQQANPDAPTPNVSDESAVDFLIRIAKEQPGEITILCLAPLSNLAVAQ